MLDCSVLLIVLLICADLMHIIFSEGEQVQQGEEGQGEGGEAGEAEEGEEVVDLAQEDDEDDAEEGEITGGDDQNRASRPNDLWVGGELGLLLAFLKSMIIGFCIGFLGVKDAKHFFKIKFCVYFW